MPAGCQSMRGSPRGSQRRGGRSPIHVVGLLAPSQRRVCSDFDRQGVGHRHGGDRRSDHLFATRRLPKCSAASYTPNFSRRRSSLPGESWAPGTRAARRTHASTTPRAMNWWIWHELARPQSTTAPSSLSSDHRERFTSTHCGGLDKHVRGHGAAVPHVEDALPCRGQGGHRRGNLGKARVRTATI